MLLPLHSARAAKVVVKAADGFDPKTVKRAAFLPFVRVIPVDASSPAVCPRDHNSREACKLEEAAEAELSRAFGQALGASGDTVSWVSQEDINAARARLKAGDGGALSIGGPLQLALGKELNVDAVLFGFVYCYRNRSGNALASGTPAAIGFCLHLVEPRTGKELWSLSYEDEQKALSDNLLDAPSYLKRKGQWITAEQMAQEAARNITARLPWRGRPQPKKKP
jgi:hypothetical protein